ncbi:MAG: type II secretion system F family protein [Planctomycetes bacterium]|nr:type II secretion system F family protein [Planctomycetota bacterium]
MDTTLLLYASLLVVLVGATVVLMVRDLNAAGNSGAAVEESIRLLPPPVADAFKGQFTDRIDWRFRRLVYQTGLDITAEPAFLLIILCGLAVGGTVFVARDDILEAVMASLVGLAAPVAFFTFRRGRRLAAIRAQLPEVMDLMSRAVRAGETLDQAIGQVGVSMPVPLGIEFRRCARQLDMGLSLPATMRALIARAPLTEVRILAATFNVQRRSGGNLAITLDRLAGVIRDRISYQRQFMAATGASRIATLVVSLAGPTVFTYMMMFEPEYVGQFFVVPGGQLLLGLACVLQFVGLVWVAGLLRNDY